LVLIGLAGSGTFISSLPAGQPIQFSSPKKELNMPAFKEINYDLPRPSLGVEVPDPGAGAVPMVPFISIEPLRDRKLKDKGEQDKSWLFREPVLFRNRFSDSLENTNPAGAGAFKAWDERAARILGSSGPNTLESQQQDPAASGRYSDKPLFDRERNTMDRTQPSSRNSWGTSRNEQMRNSSESAMRSFFETRSPSDSLPLLPGMSFYDANEASRASSTLLKQEQQARRQEFNRLLSPTMQTVGGPLDPLGFQDKPASTAPAFIMPAVESTPSVLKSPYEPLSAPDAADKLTRLKQPFDDLLIRYQTQPPAPPPRLNKAVQMERLGLMSHPSVLPFPGR